MRPIRMSFLSRIQLFRIGMWLPKLHWQCQAIKWSNVLINSPLNHFKVRQYHYLNLEMANPELCGRTEFFYGRHCANKFKRDLLTDVLSVCIAFTSRTWQNGYLYSACYNWMWKAFVSPWTSDEGQQASFGQGPSAQPTDPTSLPSLLGLGFRLNTIVHLWEIPTVELTAFLMKYSPVLQVGGQFWQKQTCQGKERALVPWATLGHTYIYL